MHWKLQRSSTTTALWATRHRPGWRRLGRSWKAGNAASVRRFLGLMLKHGNVELSFTDDNGRRWAWPLVVERGTPVECGCARASELLPRPLAPHLGMRAAARNGARRRSGIAVSDAGAATRGRVRDRGHTDQPDQAGHGL